MIDQSTHEQSTFFDSSLASEPTNKKNEWYTPAYVIKAAHQVMGAVELDPASCAAANITVNADRYYTQAQNGLVQDWSCETMWLNPPYGKQYGRSVMGTFIARLVDEFAAGRVKEAILLAMDDTSTSWFRTLWGYPICFADHKVHFHTTCPTKKSPTATHMHGTIFVYLGTHEERFIEVFSTLGVVARRVSPSKSSSMQKLPIGGAQW